MIFANMQKENLAHARTTETFLTEGEKTSGILPIRDPFILPYQGTYYMYRTDLATGVYVLRSTDLENWSAPSPVFTKPEGFHGYADLFWAPEVHYYKGNFYLFTSVKSSRYNDHRVISVYRSSSPMGPFEDIADGALSPTDWDAIDGTLWIENGKPYLVFVHEWTCMPDSIGGMVVAELSDDLSRLVSEPVELFRADAPVWATRGITDGPFIIKLSDGSLCMTWSNFTANGYAVGVCASASGSVFGPWVQRDELLYGRGKQPGFVFDGGHGMAFLGFDGKTRFCLHTPNRKREDNVPEHLSIFDLEEENGTLVLK